MKAETLIFSWIRYESARAIGSGAGSQRHFTLNTIRHGRPWATRVAMGFWRSFGALDLGDPMEVVSFVRRFGEPYGSLTPGNDCTTTLWGLMRDPLSVAAGAWDPADDDGLSHISADRAKIAFAKNTLFDAKKLLERSGVGFEKTPEPRNATLRLTIRSRPKTLAAFMIASAAAALDRRVPMRMCRTCGQWFERVSTCAPVELVPGDIFSSQAETKGGVVMASVRKKQTAAGTTIFQARWQEPGKSGKPCQKSKNFGKHADAKAYATRMEQEIERRGVGDYENHRTGQFLNRWHATLVASGEYALTTLSLYTSNIGLLVGDVGGIGHIPLARLNAHDIDQAMARLRKGGARGKGRGKKGRGGPLTAKTLLSVFQMLRAALEQARKWRFVAENPARDARAPTPQRSQAKPFFDRRGIAAIRGGCRRPGARHLLAGGCSALGVKAQRGAGPRL